MSEILNPEQVDQLGQQLVEESATAEAIKNEDIKVSEEEALILRYEQLKDAVVQWSTKLSSRQMGRVMRAAIRYPFEKEPKFVSGVECKKANYDFCNSL
jgi:hypothetical protein